MQQGPTNTVTARYNRRETAVPILVPTDARHPDALDTFFADGEGHQGLRVLRPNDFNQTLQRELSKEAHERFRELVALRERIALQGEPSYWLTFFQKEREIGAQASAAIKGTLRADLAASGEPGQDTQKLIARWQLRRDPLRYLSVAISEKLAGARLVLWWRGQPWAGGYLGDSELKVRIADFLHQRRADYIPAVYCPDLETAFYVSALFKFCGAGFGLCLECGEVFQKERPDQLYCCPSHRDAFRIRRWRKEKEKSATEMKEPKRRKRGNEKKRRRSRKI